MVIGRLSAPKTGRVRACAPYSADEAGSVCALEKQSATALGRSFHPLGVILSLGELLRVIALSVRKKMGVVLRNRYITAGQSPTVGIRSLGARWGTCLWGR
jgi:hypothetical protein